MLPAMTLLADPAPRDARLSIALAEGLALPEGAITVLHPRAGEVYDVLDRTRLHMVQPFRPDHDALAAMGYSVSPDFSAAPVALVCLPRAKALALDLIARASETAALVLVDGQKTDGIESVFKLLRGRVSVLGNITKAHGRLFWYDPRGVDLSDLRAPLHHITAPDGRMFQTGAGAFSADGIDPGSKLLADALPDVLPATMADLGAGWGYLSASVLARGGVETLHMVEADASALALAHANVPDPRAVAHWADATTFAPPTSVGGVVMNPPFHTGRSAQPALGLAFIAAAARILSPRGHLWMVANRHLPYDAPLAETFAEVTLLTQTPSFKVWHARVPKRGKAKAQTRNPR